MSVSERGGVPLKTGNVSPADDRHADQDKLYAHTIAAALRAELGMTHQAVKTVMRWTDAGERTVKAWLAGTSGPSGTHLVALLRHSDGVFNAVLATAGRKKALAAATIATAHQTLIETVRCLEAAMAD